MSDLIEGVGTASEGGMFARMLEPESGTRLPHPDQPLECLNCGTVLIGAYCHACGQRGHVHRTIGAFVHELLHGALHFEGKLWRTLPLLVLRPGHLTRRYIEGARARFVSPMALFLFSVFLMFAVFQMLGITTPSVAPQDVSELETVEAQEIADREIAELREALDDPSLSPTARVATKERIELLARMREEAVLTNPLAGIAAGVRAGTREDGESDLTQGRTGLAPLDALIARWSANPTLMLYKLQANAYKFSWLLIPLSIPFVWLLFAWRRQFKAYDHAIFVTYSLGFMTLLFVTVSVLGVIGMPEAALLPALLIVPPIHLYKQLRNAYGLSRLSAGWRLFVLSIFIWIVVLMFLLLLLGAF